MADTLLAVADEELQKANDEQKRAQADLAQAQTDLAAAQQKLNDATDQLTTLQDEAITIRRKIAVTTVAADGKALFDDLDANTSKRRMQQAAMAEAQDAIAYARSRITNAQDELGKGVQAAHASTQVAQAMERSDTDHATWIAAAGTAKLTGLPAKADITTAGPAKTAAVAAAARLDGGSGGDIPAELFARAGERRQARLDRINALNTLALLAESRQADEDAKAGLSGVSAKAQLAYERSEAALRDFVLTAQERYDRALTLLGGVQNSTPLNTDESSRITELNTAAVAATVFVLESNRDAAQTALDEQQDVVDAAILDAIAKNPSADPTTDAAVQTEQGKLPALQGTLDTANTVLAADKDKLDALEAAIPDATWALFDDYAEALELLAELAAADPAALATALTTDESLYAQALRAEQDSARTVSAVGELVREWEDRAAATAQSRPSRLLEALRGDD